MTSFIIDNCCLSITLRAASQSNKSTKESQQDKNIFSLFLQRSTSVESTWGWGRDRRQKVLNSLAREVIQGRELHSEGGLIQVVEALYKWSGSALTLDNQTVHFFLVMVGVCQGFCWYCSRGFGEHHVRHLSRPSRFHLHLWEADM